MTCLGVCWYSSANVETEITAVILKTTIWNPTKWDIMKIVNLHNGAFMGGVYMFSCANVGFLCVRIIRNFKLSLSVSENVNCFFCLSLCYWLCPNSAAASFEGGLCHRNVLRLSRFWGSSSCGPRMRLYFPDLRDESSGSTLSWDALRGDGEVFFACNDGWSEGQFKTGGKNISSLKQVCCEDFCLSPGLGGQQRTKDAASEFGHMNKIWIYEIYKPLYSIFIYYWHNMYVSYLAFVMCSGDVHFLLHQVVYVRGGAALDPFLFLLLQLVCHHLDGLCPFISDLGIKQQQHTEFI